MHKLAQTYVRTNVEEVVTHPKPEDAGDDGDVQGRVRDVSVRHPRLAPLLVQRHPRRVRMRGMTVAAAHLRMYDSAAGNSFGYLAGHADSHGGEPQIMLILHRSTGMPSGG